MKGLYNGVTMKLRYLWPKGFQDRVISLSQEGRVRDLPGWIGISLTVEMPELLAGTLVSLLTLSISGKTGLGNTLSFFAS